MSRFMQKKSVFFIEKVDFSFKSYVPDEFQVYKNDKNIEILNDSARSPPSKHVKFHRFPFKSYVPGWKWRKSSI